MARCNRWPFIVALVSMVAYYISLLRGGVHEGRPIRVLDLTGNDGHRRHIAELLSQAPRVPFILKNSAPSQWAAVGKWSPQFVLGALAGSGAGGPPLAVFQNSRPQMGAFHDASRPLAALAPRPAPPNLYAVVNMSAPQLLDRLARADGSQQFYLYSAHVNDNIAARRPELAEDLDPFDAVELNPQDQQLNANLWVSGAGVVTHPHYDSFDNLNVQLTGRKRWTLRPPASMVLHPFLHPCNAQAIYVDGQPPLVTDPPYVGVTGPGDVLFLPAYWMHGVETETDSVNLNNWSRRPDVDSLVTRLHGVAKQARSPGSFVAGVLSRADAGLARHLFARYDYLPVNPDGRAAAAAAAAAPFDCAVAGAGGSSSRSTQKSVDRFFAVLDQLPHALREIVAADALELAAFRVAPSPNTKSMIPWFKQCARQVFVG